MKHTKEPWKVIHKDIEFGMTIPQVLLQRDDDGYSLTMDVNGGDNDEMEANAKRIVDCVNFLEGISEMELNLLSRNKINGKFLVEYYKKTSNSN